MGWMRDWLVNGPYRGGPSLQSGGLLLAPAALGWVVEWFILIGWSGKGKEGSLFDLDLSLRSASLNSDSSTGSSSTALASPPYHWQQRRKSGRSRMGESRPSTGTGILALLGSTGVVGG